jgi:hypothetical protein
MDACVPRGWDPIPARQFGQRYALVRRDSSAPESPIFDPDETILAAVVLSRIIRPNPSGFEWSLRVLESESAKRLVPLDPAAAFSAYVPDPTARNWLDASEAEELRQLLDAYWSVENDLPERIGHSMWLTEHGSREPYIEVAWLLAVTALEALIHTDRTRSKRQFVARVMALAEEVSLANVDEAFLATAYEHRSEGVHGTRVEFHQDPAAAEEFGRLQRVLRLTHRRAIEDVDFCSIFHSAESVRSQWPI